MITLSLCASLLVAGIMTIVWPILLRDGAGFSDRRILLPWKTVTLLCVSGVTSVILAAPRLWVAARHGYPGDSFFTLSLGSAIGLALLCAGLTVLLLVCSLLKSRWLHRVVSDKRTGVTRWVCTGAADLLLTVSLFMGCYSLAPQIFYLYYQIIFPDLRSQWVPKQLEGPAVLWKLLQFEADASIALHQAGVALWALIVLSVWLTALSGGGFRRQPLPTGLVSAGSCMICLLCNL